MITAELDGKGIGKNINELALEGKIKPVVVAMADGRRLDANSTWAATDWKKRHGYYEPDGHLLPACRIIPA